MRLPACERGSDVCLRDGGKGAARLGVLISFWALMVLIIAGAAVLRLASLDNRAMHCDEAVHALKFGPLLEEGDYVYDPWEYHGPSLNFLTLPIARLAAAEKLTDITETHLRLLPAIFGIVLIGLVWLLREELGREAALYAALLTAVSPAMVFFSRYYIQEMLLVGFTFGAMVALWRYARALGTAKASPVPPRCPVPPQWLCRPALWLVLLGLCVGMMHASKETCVIALLAMAVAAALTMRSLRQIGLKRIVLSGVAVGVVAASVSALFYSSFLHNPHGVVDSYATYLNYFDRASGEGTTGRHDYPWYHHLRTLFWWHRGSGPLWTEGSIAVLALVGLVAGSLGKGLRPVSLPIVRFLSVYTVLMTVIYSAVSYKTPWCALGFLHGMILLAGVGGTILARAAPGYISKAVVIALLAAATGHLACQAWRASFVDYQHPNNPYVYAHTTGDVPLLAQRVREIAAVHPDAEAMHIQVICPDDDHWPLPWYLRGFTRVDWFPGIPRGRPAPLIVTQPKMEPALADYLYVRQPPGQRHVYVPVPTDHQDRDWQLRPNVPLRPYIRLDLWEAYLASLTGQIPSGEDESERLPRP